jgi:glycosyltransferase involved in cell wall biosynthesis
LKILFCSHLFYPSIGGSEEVGRTLTLEFVRQGHDVRVITSTPSTGKDDFGFLILRRPNTAQIIKSFDWCDIVFHNNISLRTAWPLLLIHRPWVVVHHTWMARPDGSIGWQDRLKRFSLRFATNISVSNAVARSLPVSSVVIGNPYRADLFREIPNHPRDLDLVFLGRLVSEKGLNILVESMSRLKALRLTPHLTIIGLGEELSSLQDLVKRLDLNSQVTFAGRREGMELVELLNRHQILVIPSRCRETFGLVALEGIACGCVIVGSSGGGLPEAIGPCGIIFENSKVGELTGVLHQLLTDPARFNGYRNQSQQHLKNFQPSNIARAYLQVFEKAIGNA